ncbi:MAG TPA: hypothetical protein VFS67_33050 [Polyangiaceae bacterium]|nr:hypothetical protein [Polyangiaceae bacterium]
MAGVFACTVTVDDSPIDDINDGASGGTSVSGSGGSSGSSAGSSSGGSSGSAGGQSGAAGSMSMVENGGSGGSGSLPTPVCTAETGDDACLTCIKQQCCTQWQACNDVACQTEREDTLSCVGMLDMADVDSDTFAECLSGSAYDMSMDFAQENTNALFACINEETTDPDAGGGTRCGIPCFGTDIFF